MKKVLGLVLGVILVIGLFAVPASAGGDHSNRAFGFTAYTDGVTLTHANQFHKKEAENFIEVRHTVPQSTAGYTNRLYGFIQNGSIYAGAKWQLPNNIYWSCTSNSLSNQIVTPGGRANTDYLTYQGLSFITIQGQFRPH